MKKILLVATVYRIGERIYPIIPELSKEFHIDILRTAQMSSKNSWYGDNDYRILFDKLYNQYVDNIFTDSIPDIKSYDLVIFDDCRPRNGLKEISAVARAAGVPTIANYEGNGYFDLDNVERDIKHWDYLSLFGEKDFNLHSNHPYGDSKKFLKGGIPANDKLRNYGITDDGENILVIVNFLGNRTSPFNIQVNTDFIKLSGLKQMQQGYNKNIVFKLKSRKDQPNPDYDKNYLNKIASDLDFDIIMDCEDDNELICKSFAVISAPSTLALKSIQRGIPTILIKDSGLNGCFYDYKGLVDLDTRSIFDELERQYHEGRDEEFIKNTIEGGIDYKSTEQYIKNIKGII